MTTIEEMQYKPDYFKYGVEVDFYYSWDNTVPIRRWLIKNSIQYYEVAYTSYWFTTKEDQIMFNLMWESLIINDS